MLNPYFIVAFLYVVLAGLGALDAALIHFELLPAFAGIRWVRVHFITLGALTEFAFGILSKGTRAEGGRLEYDRVSLKGRCSSCSHEFGPEDLVFRCPECGSADIEILAGREMEVDYILLDEEGK